MCLIAFAWQASADHPLVVAANRDEFLARPTEAAHWRDDDRRLAGRDLQGGGTWMGVTRDGRFAALTNFRDPSAQRVDAPSRGALVDAFLTGDGTADAAVRRIAGEADRFNGFNLLAGQWSPGLGPPALWVVSSPGSTAPRVVEPGIHALSNARLDTRWPKVDFASMQTGNALANTTGIEPLIERLFAMLANRTVAADDELPRTGIPVATERALSSPFIRMPGYGTRTSTVFIAERSGRAVFVERCWDVDATVLERRFEFTTPLIAAREP